MILIFNNLSISHFVFEISIYDVYSLNTGPVQTAFVNFIDRSGSLCIVLATVFYAMTRLVLLN